jgi:hypothetical protein
MLTLASEFYVFKLLGGYGGTILKGIIVYGFAFCIGMAIKKLKLKERQARLSPVIIVAWTLLFLSIITSFIAEYNIIFFVLVNWFMFPALLWVALMLGDSYSIRRDKEPLYLAGVILLPVIFLRFGVFMF